MHKRSTDGSIYVSAYVGRGDEGRKIAETIRAGAKRAGLSMSEFIMRACLERSNVSASPKPQKPPVDPAPPSSIVDNLPPSLRPKLPTPRPARAVRPRSDDDEGSLPPTIEDLAPSSKPADEQ